MATSILQVKIVAPRGERELYVDSQDAAENPALFVGRVAECVEELVSAGERAVTTKVTYLDDEGDACTLLEQSVTDALCMASPADGDKDFKVLLLSVQVDGSRRGTEDALEQLEAWMEPLEEPAAPVELAAGQPETAGVARICELHLPSTEEQHSFLDVCKRGDFKRARQLIEANPMLINVQPEMRASALHHFAMRGHEEAVRYLLDRGADPSARNVDGATPPEVADDSVLGLFIPGNEGGIVLGPAPVAVEAEPTAEAVSAEEPDRQSLEERPVPAARAPETDETSCLEILRAENAHLVESCQSLMTESSRMQVSAESKLQEAARERHRLEHELEEALARNADLLAERQKAQASLQQVHQQLKAHQHQADSLREELGKIGEEANGKIEAANDRIRSLRRERDEALRVSVELAAASPVEKGASASVVGCELVVGVEVHENEGGCGDVTEELGDLVVAQGARSAFRLGSVCLATGADAEVEAPVCAQVKIINDGAFQWPATAAVVCRSGPDFGVPLSPVGPLGAGEAAEVTLDLMLPPRSEPLQSRTSWALVDAATGCPLGPLLVLDAAWQAETL